MNSIKKKTILLINKYFIKNILKSTGENAAWINLLNKDIYPHKHSDKNECVSAELH